MDRVFVLLENVPFEGGAVIGVFSTREGAERYCRLNPVEAVHDEDYAERVHWLIEERLLDELCEGEGENDDGSTNG